MLGQRGCVVWFTGLSGSGKSTVACTVEHELARRGSLTALLDGDNVRHGLNKVHAVGRIGRADPADRSVSVVLSALMNSIARHLSEYTLTLHEGNEAG